MNVDRLDIPLAAFLRHIFGWHVWVAIMSGAVVAVASEDLIPDPQRWGTLMLVLTAICAFVSWQLWRDLQGKRADPDWGELLRVLDASEADTMAPYWVSIRLSLFSFIVSGAYLATIRLSDWGQPSSGADVILASVMCTWSVGAMMRAARASFMQDTRMAGIRSAREEREAMERLRKAAAS